jgi:hypothetical protein
MNVCSLVDILDRLNGRLGLRETDYDRVDGSPEHIASASLAIEFRPPWQGLSDTTYISREVGICMSISYEQTN